MVDAWVRAYVLLEFTLIGRMYRILFWVAWVLAYVLWVDHPPVALRAMEGRQKNTKIHKNLVGLCSARDFDRIQHATAKRT